MEFLTGGYDHLMNVRNGRLNADFEEKKKKGLNQEKQEKETDIYLVWYFERLREIAKSLSRHTARSICIPPVYTTIEMFPNFDAIVGKRFEWSKELL